MEDSPLCRACAGAAALTRQNGAHVFHWVTFDHLALWFGWMCREVVADASGREVWAMVLALAGGAGGPGGVEVWRGDLPAPLLSAFDMVKAIRRAPSCGADLDGATRSIVALVLLAVVDERLDVLEAAGYASPCEEVLPGALRDAAALWQLAGEALQTEATAPLVVRFAGLVHPHLVPFTAVVVLLCLLPANVRHVLEAPVRCAACGLESGDVLPLGRSCELCAPRPTGARAPFGVYSGAVLNPLCPKAGEPSLVSGALGSSLLVSRDETFGALAGLWMDWPSRGVCAHVRARIDGARALDFESGRVVDYVDPVLVAAVEKLHGAPAWYFSLETFEHHDVRRHWLIALVDGHPVGVLRPRRECRNGLRPCSTCGVLLDDSLTLAWAVRACDAHRVRS